jgi:hypothetical protein
MLKRMLFLTYVCVASSLLFFSLIEIFPELQNKLNLDAIRYYAQKRGNVVDDKLGYRPRLTNFTYETVFNGDLYDVDPHLAEVVPPLALKYTATYKDGFRANSSPPPYDMLVLGDSFLEIGENDSSTFSELVGKYGGLATFNLGRGSYDPPVQGSASRILHSSHAML